MRLIAANVKDSSLHALLVPYVVGRHCTDLTHFWQVQLQSFVIEDIIDASPEKGTFEQKRETAFRR